MKHFFLFVVFSFLSAAMNAQSSCDVNGDGYVNIADVSAVINEICTSGTKSYSPGTTKDALLTPDDEKVYIQSVGESMEKFCKASDFTTLTSLAKEFDNMDNSVLTNYVKNALRISTLTDSTMSQSQYYWNNGYNTQTYSYNYILYNYIYTNKYYERIINATLAKGTFEGSYATKKWVKTNETGDLTIKYTDSHNALWVVTTRQSGSTGKISIGDYSRRDNYNGGYGYYPYVSNVTDTVTFNYLKKYYDDYINVPTHVTLTVTRVGITMVETKINITKFLDCVDEKYQPSFLGRCAGTIELYIKPIGDAFNINGSFDYTNFNTSKVHTTIDRGTTNLITFDMNCVPYSYSSQDFGTTKSINVKTSILDKLTIIASATDGKAIYDIYQTQTNNESSMKSARDVINNSMTATIYNGPQNATKQASLKVNLKSVEHTCMSYQYINGTYRYNPTSYYTYEFIPSLLFGDGTTYSVEEFFTKSFFQSILDYFQKQGDEFKDMTD